MSSYMDFNEEYLRNEVAKLDELIKKTTDPIRCYDLCIQADFLENELPDGDSLAYDESKEYKKESSDDKMAKNNDFLNSYWGKIYIPSLTLFHKNAKRYMDDYELDIEYEMQIIFTEYYPEYLSYKEQLGILRDFYNSIEDKEIRDAFNKVFKDRRNTLRFIPDDCYVNFFTDSKGNNKSLISLYDKLEAINLENIAHEFGHAIDHTFQKPFFYKNKDAFEELMSTFFQLLMLKYMKNNNIDSTGAIFCEVRNHILRFMELDSYLALYKIRNKPFANGELYFNYIKKNMHHNIQRFASNIPANRLIMYSLPYAIVIELLSLYEHDPEYALHILKELSCSINTSRLKELEKYDIHIGDHVEEKTKKLVAEIKMTKKRTR